LTLLLPKPAGAKVFWFFFSKKNRLLALRDGISTNQALAVFPRVIHVLGLLKRPNLKRSHARYQDMMARQRHAPAAF
jgi:hypothetical protein